MKLRENFAIYLNRGANKKPNILKITREIKMTQIILKIFLGFNFGILIYDSKDKKN